MSKHFAKCYALKLFHGRGIWVSFVTSDKYEYFILIGDNNRLIW